MLSYTLKNCKIYVINDNYVILSKINEILGCQIKDNKILWRKSIYDEVSISDHFIACEDSDSNSVTLLNIRDGTEFKNIHILEFFYLTKTYIITTNDNYHYKRINIYNNTSINFKLNKNIHSICDDKLLLTANSSIATSSGTSNCLIYDVDSFKILETRQIPILSHILYENNYLVIYDHNQIKVINKEIEKTYIMEKLHKHTNQQIAGEHDMIYNMSISNDGNKVVINNGHKMQIINIDSSQIKLINSDKLICDVKFYQEDKLLISNI
jgi:hypothetical protein